MFARSPILLSLALLFVCGRCGVADEPQPLRVHLLSGSNEYRSNESLRTWSAKLTKTYHVRFTGSYGTDKAKHLDGLGEIANADVLVIFARRLALPEADMSLIRAHWEAGKPVIGIRTASHAFQKADNELLDRTILGGDYTGHYGDETAIVTNAKGTSGSPFLTGVESWTSAKLYKAGELPKTTTVLQYASFEDGTNRQPVTWTTTYNGAKTFYTALGIPSDFENPNFQRLLHNALEQVSGRKLMPRRTAAVTP